MFSVTNPNFKNTNKSVNFRLQALEIDRIADYGYKNNKLGFSVGTNFEYLDDLNLGLSTSSFYEKIETDSTASAMQKKQEGNYWDTFLKIDFDYDKRDQKFQTTDGFRSRYFLDLPIILLRPPSSAASTERGNIRTGMPEDNKCLDFIDSMMPCSSAEKPPDGCLINVLIASRLSDHFIPDASSFR